MTWKTRLLFRESLFTASAFTAAMYLYYFTAVWGVKEHLSIGPLQDYLGSDIVHVEILMAGILMGTLIGVINRIIERPRFRDRPISTIILLRTALYLAGVGLVAGLVLLVYATFILPWDALSELLRVAVSRYTLTFLVYTVLVMGLINFFLEIWRIVGPAQLWHLLRGRYRHPHEEKRVFLFMDMHASTTIAERLGHRRYSEFLRECYRDLTPVALQYDATIYQYVGDEIVLTWLCNEDASRTKTSVEAFFAYRSMLHRRREHYGERFGAVPEFRGGIDAGTVTVIEIGDMKRDIVYLGDTLNTAARLLELCKELEEELVVSCSVGKLFEHDAKIRTRWHEEVSLRGKSERIEAYSLQAADDVEQ
jgi:adenylate cyclase